MPRLDELAVLGQVNYGHFTTLQVRDRRARGFSLHLGRLVAATRELFGCELDPERVRGLVRQILDDAPGSLRVTVFSQALDLAHLERPVEQVDVLVALRPAREPRTDPVRLRSVVHQRVLPKIKHVGTFGLFHEWRQARLAGFDDVVFCTPDGEISEGSIWNIGFWDGRRVTWPDAPALPGITRQLLETGLRDQGIETATRAVRCEELGGFRSAFIVNSGGVGPLVRSIDGIAFDVEPELARQLQLAYESQPLEPI